MILFMNCLLLTSGSFTISDCYSNRKAATHDDEIQRLYEEMEQQIKNEKDRMVLQVKTSYWPPIEISLLFLHGLHFPVLCPVASFKTTLKDYERFLSRSQELELQLSSKEKELEQLFQKQRRVRGNVTTYFPCRVSCCICSWSRTHSK